MNLHSDKEAFKEIIALAAEHFGYEQSHVEKVGIFPCPNMRTRPTSKAALHFPKPTG